VSSAAAVATPALSVQQAVPFPGFLMGAVPCA
jgi:hypothetical protein